MKKLFYWKFLFLTGALSIAFASFFVAEAAESESKSSSVSEFERWTSRESIEIENSFRKITFPENLDVLYKKLDSGLEICRIFIDGTFFAEFRSDYRGTPIVWPICSENGSLATRAYPMIEDENVDSLPESNDYEIQYKNVIQNAWLATVADSKDHPHQRSLWFTHGKVDDCDFWALTDSKIRSRIVGIENFASDSNGWTTKGIRLAVECEWVADGAGRTICRDRRTISFGVLRSEDCPKTRFVDYEIQLVASEKDVLFGDTKEGTFGVRVPGSMDVEATKRNPLWNGRILNDGGDLNEKAWGKRAKWVEYSGTVARRLNREELQEQSRKENSNDFELTSLGITIMNRPTSFRFPSWFHVRTYGLFAVNPFGRNDFEPERKDDGDGSYLLSQGETETFQYRVLFADGERSKEQIDGVFEQFCR